MFCDNVAEKYCVCLCHLHAGCVSGYFLLVEFSCLLSLEYTWVSDKCPVINTSVLAWKVTCGYLCFNVDCRFVCDGLACPHLNADKHVTVKVFLACHQKLCSFYFVSVLLLFVFVLIFIHRKYSRLSTSAQGKRYNQNTNFTITNTGLSCKASGIDWASLQI